MKQSQCQFEMWQSYQIKYNWMPDNDDDDGDDDDID